jgi:Arc/MetJ family transcription regulator
MAHLDRAEARKPRNEALITPSFDDSIDAQENFVMRTTLALDDELVSRAQELTGLKEKSALVREALKALVEREAARRLARLGGTAPDFVAASRRRPE